MKAILVALQYNHMNYDFDISLNELKELCIACHIEVTKIIIQNIEPTKPYYVGKGKVEEIKNCLMDEDMVIFNEELSPLQVKNLTDALGVQISDRTDLILKIFESRAQTKEAKLQVEIAKLKYQLPRLAGLNEEIYSQQGGSGFRGSGEKQIEIDRRIIHRQLIQARRELEAIKKTRQTQRKQRKRNGQKVVALVGYTNSGKSSLLNYFTQKKVFEKDMLFATLETSTRQVSLKGHKQILLSDTVGFISQLPHHLIEAFMSTLEEVKEADLLIQVVDSSSTYAYEQIQVTNKVLEALGVKDTPMLYVYNKIDLNKYSLLAPEEPYVYISVKEQIHLDQLEDEIIQLLFKEYELVEMIIPYSDGQVYQEFSQTMHIRKEEYLEEGIYVLVEVPHYYKEKYASYLLKEQKKYN